jgi:hypothetical protein
MLRSPQSGAQAGGDNTLGGAEIGMRLRAMHGMHATQLNATSLVDSLKRSSHNL